MQSRSRLVKFWLKSTEISCVFYRVVLIKILSYKLIMVNNNDPILYTFQEAELVQRKCKDKQHIAFLKKQVELKNAKQEAKLMEELEVSFLPKFTWAR